MASTSRNEFTPGVDDDRLVEYINSLSDDESVESEDSAHFRQDTSEGEVLSDSDESAIILRKFCGKLLPDILLLSRSKNQSR